MTNPYLAGAEDLAQEQPRNRYSTAAAELADENRTALRTSIYGAAALTPEQGASAVRLSRQTGLPVDLVQRNLPEVQQRVAIERVEADTADSPVLRRRYTDPAFAAVAHDDSSALKRLERSVQKAVRYLVGADGKDGIFGDVKAGYYGAQAGTAGAFRAVAETAAVPFDVLERFPSIGGNPLRRLAEGFDTLAQQNARARERSTKPTEGMVSSGVSSGVQSLTQSALMLPLALLPGGQGAALTGMSASSGGQSYQRAREAGVPQGTALAYGASDAAIEYATERIPVGRLIGDLKAGTPVVQTLLRQAGAEIPGEQIATIAQDLNEWAVLNPDRPFADYLRERPSAAAQTLIATLISSGGNVAVMKGVQAAVDRVAGDGRRAEEAQLSAQELAAVVKDADASALKTRDPQALAEFVREVQPDAAVYVAPEHLAGVDVSAVPGLAAQVQEAQATGGDVRIELADLLAHLPAEQLLPNLRTAPHAMTPAEAQGFDAPTRMLSEVMQPVEGALLTSPAQTGMDGLAWNDYQTAAVDAAQAAIAERDQRLLRDLQWLETAKSKAAREIAQQVAAARSTIEAEVQAEVQKQAPYAVQRWLKTGMLPDGTQTVGARLNTPALREMFGDGPAAPWRYLPSNMLDAVEGLHPDVVAEMFGFNSGDEMVRAMLSAEPESDLVQRLTEERLLDEHPDIADAIAQERSAEAMVFERARLRFLATESAALARAVGNRVLLAQEAKRYAEASIARRTVRAARPAQFKASAERAERASAEAFRQGETAMAAKWKQSQFLQAALQSEAAQAQQEVQQALRLFKRVIRGNDEGRDGNLAATARAVLAMYGIGASDKTPADHLAQVQRYDPELYADLQALMEGMPGPAADYRDLTVADFRAVAERVGAIWSLAKSTLEFEVAGQRMAIEEAAAQLANVLAQEPAAKRERQVGTNQRLDLRMRLQGMRAALRRVEFWADARDKGDKAGPFRRFIWEPVSEAVTRYRARRNEYVSGFLKLLRTIEPTLKPGKIAAPELADGMVFADRSALLHALLHTGNESNKRKLLLGYGWAEQLEDGSLDTSRWDRFLRRMHDEGRITKADWDFVQSVWDLLETTKPAAQAAHRRMFGTFFEEITAEPVETPFGQLRGGYVPAVTDPLLLPEARTHGAIDDMLSSQNSPMFPAVNRGFTKSRIENYSRPLALDLRLLPAHLDKVARFSELGPVLRDTARLVTRNRTFRDAMNAVDPTAIESLLAPWLKRTAVQSLTKAPESQADRAVARIANRVRSRTGLLLMSANVINTLQQVTGLSVAALRVKPRYLAAGMWEYMRNPRKTGQAITELSQWMQQRGDSSARDVERAIDDLLTNPNALERAEQLGNRYGYALQQGAQNVLDRIVWLGAFRQAAAEGRSDADQVRAADSAVRMTQSSFAPEDAAKVEHAGAFTRLFLMFYSYFGGQANLLATEAQNARGNPGRLALVYLLGFAIPAFVADVISKGLRGDLDDEDDEPLADKLLAYWFGSQARYALAMAPVVGQVGNAAIGQLTPERFDDRIGASPAYSAAEATVRAPFTIYRAIEEDGNPKAAVRDGLTAAALLTGLPVGPLVRPLGYLADDELGDDVTLRGLITGKDDAN
ncbi:MAG: hypothetical protein AB1430_17340 [Pseudomonadota bacterium]